MKQLLYQHHFKGKKITVMGLGLLGRGVQVTEFLAKQGAVLTVTDMKDAKALAPSLKKLSKYKIRYVLGKHDMKDFENVDMVVKAAGVPLDSPYIAHAKKSGVEVVMDASLFARLAPMVDIVGITGTRGKSMTTTAIYHVLKSHEKSLGCKVYSGGNLRGQATLPLLAKVNPPAGGKDIVVLELDSWQCQGFGDEKISPTVAVFTSFMEDHQNYYGGSMKKYFADKAHIFSHQTKGDTLVILRGMKKWITRKDVAGKLVVADSKSLRAVKLKVVGEHQAENIACAYEVAKLFGLKESSIKKSLAQFKGLEGRMELLREVRGIKIYNDNNATTPQATSAGLTALAISSPNFAKATLGKRKSQVASKRTILIGGGNDKNIDLDDLVKAIKKFTKAVYLTPGNGTDRLVALCQEKKVPVFLVRDLAHGVREALHVAKRGDSLLFSPAFSSFAQYNNEYERNDEFIRIVKRLK